MSAGLPVIFSYCATFLPREMRHVYRQVAGVGRFENHVITRQRANAGEFPFGRIHCLRKPPLRFLARMYYRARRALVPVSRFEIAQMHRLIEAQGGQLAHVYLGTEALRVLPFLRETRAARIVSFHGADLAKAQSADLYRPLWALSELVLCRSLSLAQELIAKGCPEEKIRLNYTGVPVPPAPRRTGVAQGGPVRLVQVCRLIEKKGLEVTLEAAARLRAQGWNLRLTFAGDGPLREALERQARDLGMGGQVIFTGFLGREPLRELLEASDIFVHPSRETGAGDREGIPNSLLEAMAAGLPCIATRHSGIPEAIEDGVSGLLIDEARADLLAGAAGRLVQTAGLFERIAAGGRRRVEERFSIESCIASLEAHYEEAIRLSRTR